MSLSAVEYRDGARTSWDWKQEYIERLKNGDGLEMFSQASVTSDTMLILAGPPRIPDDGFKELLSPIGLITDVSFSSENGLRPMWELGTDQTYFTRGKTSYQLSIGAMVANKPSLMKLMTRQSPVQGEPDQNGAYPEAPDHVGQFWANMDTENTAAPFGILMIFKTKGGQNTDNNGDLVSAMYLENCNIGSFAFNMSSQAVTLQENVSIMFDRMLAVDYS